MIYISFSIKSISQTQGNPEDLEKLYNSVYKPLIKLINHYPELRFTFSITGTLLSYLKRKRKEYISLLRQLAELKQIDILGGGYHDPILPLLLTVDRNGQIDKLTSELRQTIGIRPRGINLFCDCWDSSLVNTLQVCGIEYVLLDKNIIPSEKCQFLPLIMNNLGKSIEIFPTYDEFIPTIDTTPEKYVESITKAIKKLNVKSNFVQFEPNRIINVEFSHEELATLLEGKWFETFLQYIKLHPELEIETGTVKYYRKHNNIKLPVHISSGISKESISLLDKNNGISGIYDYMDYFPLAKNLYNRLSYTSTIINQYKKDKMRKNSAREKLWQAQNGVGLIFTANGEFLETRYRQTAYKYLMEAEKLIQEDSVSKELLSAFDYNGDGLNEYVCRMKNYFSYITTVGGAIQELSIMKNTGNYADNLSRNIKFDGYSDNYERGFFVDHIFDSQQIKQYLEGKPAGDGIFSRIIYSELSFSPSHHELQLCATAIIPKTKQKIFLRKKYFINSDGMNVQYIIRNESNKPLDINFAIESNIANTNYCKDCFTYYKMDFVSEGEVYEIDTSKNIKDQEKSEYLTNADTDMVRITDSEAGVSFCFEPNEKSKFLYYPLTFMRPDKNNSLQPVHLTFVTCLYWHLMLEPGKETEKTINFSITSVKKTKKNL